MPDGPFITVETAGIVHACWRRCSVSVVRGSVTIPDIEALERGFEAYMSEHPGKHVTFSYVLPSDDRLDAKVRDRIKVMMDNYGADTLAAAYVIPADGLTGALQRSILTSIMMLTRGAYPRKVFKSLEDGCAWGAGHLQSIDPDLAADPTRLVTVIRGLAGA